MRLSKPGSRNLRKGRHSQSGQYYFLTTSIAGRRRVFARPTNALVVLDAIRWLNNKDRFIVDAAVVMPDHIHLVGQLGENSLASVMHSMKSFSACKLAMVGVEMPVWQPGYHDHGLRDDEDYRARVGYVLHNPLRAGLVDQIEDYPFIILPEWWGGAFESRRDAAPTKVERSL